MSEKLDRREKMQPIHTVIGNIAAGARKALPAIPVFRARKVWATVRATFSAQGDDHIYLEAFYSPDGSNYDTSTLFSTFLPVRAGNTRQISHCFSCIPEVGSIKFEIYNADDVQVDNVSVFVGVSKWDNNVSMEAGEKPGVR